MFKISDFSRFTRVSVKMLRHYDELGLLKPVSIDSQSGYRYYSSDQLPRLNPIIALKDLGFRVEQIGKLLDENHSPDEIRGMFRMRQEEIEQNLQLEQARLAQVEARLRFLEQEIVQPNYDVVLRDIAPQLVASIRQRVSVAGAFVEPCFAKLFGAGWGWRACFFVSVLPAVLVIVIRQFMPESDIWEAWQRHPERRAAAGPAFLVLLRRDRAIRRLCLLGLFLAVTDMSAYWFTYAWMPKYLYDKLHFSMARSGIWMLVTQAGGVLGYLSFGMVADWKGRRIAYTVYSLLWSVALFSVTLFWSSIVDQPALTLFCTAHRSPMQAAHSGY